MGQQQILVMLVGVIITGLMIAVAFVMFGDQAAASNRDAIASDLVRIATIAQQYQHKPRLLGGGDGSMVGFVLPGRGWNINGNFTLSTITATSLVIEGIGVEIGYDEIHPVKVAIRVTKDSVQVTEIN
jgi:hypothetical protein